MRVRFIFKCASFGTTQDTTFCIFIVNAFPTLVVLGAEIEVAEALHRINKEDKETGLLKRTKKNCAEHLNKPRE